MAVLPLFSVLNLKICLQPVYINVKIIIFWEKKKKKRISFFPLPHVINVGFVLKCTEVNKTLKMYCYRAYYLTPFGEDV